MKRLLIIALFALLPGVAGAGDYQPGHAARWNKLNNLCLEETGGKKEYCREYVDKHMKRWPDDPLIEVIPYQPSLKPMAGAGDYSTYFSNDWRECYGDDCPKIKPSPKPAAGKEEKSCSQRWEDYYSAIDRRGTHLVHIPEPDCPYPTDAAFYLRHWPLPIPPDILREIVRPYHNLYGMADKPPKPVRWEVHWFNLLEGSECEKVVFCHWSVLAGRLNRLLRNGWELQEPYHGEFEVWLKRRVAD